MTPDLPSGPHLADQKGAFDVCIIGEGLWEDGLLSPQGFLFAPDELSVEDEGQLSRVVNSCLLCYVNKDRRLHSQKAISPEHSSRAPCSVFIVTITKLSIGLSMVMKFDSKEGLLHNRAYDGFGKPCFLLPPPVSEIPSGGA